ncbi:MAG: PQQ-dependent sugar dehydrogenase, partial [Chloroflexi bacterium]|nr:PQQ-dependent sugar dehydrogenase [Chloroflexota bacterium]
MVTGLKQPTYVAGTPDGKRFLFVLERQGYVRLVDPSGHLQPTPLLDLTSAVSMRGDEQGLLGLAFDPSFTTNGYVYISYTADDSSYQLERYTVARDSSYQIDPSSAFSVLAAPKQSPYHNGGMLAFGPDGFLYVGLGDDNNSDNPQTLGTLFGKILRLDVSGPPTVQGYAIPPSNPFADTPGARGEIWAYGLRNPWRFSFDRATGDLWIGDVGEATWER